MNRTFQAKTRLLAFVSALALPAAVLGGCNEVAQTEPKQSALVEVQAAEVVTLPASVTLTGAVAARVESDLGFRIAGRVAARYAEVGDRVRKGQLLAMLETTQQAADVSAARARLAGAQATLREAQATFQRQSALLSQGFTTRTRFDDAKQALDSAMANVDRSKAEFARTDDTLSNAELRATADGVITARNAEVGQVLEVAQKVYSLAKDGPRDAVFEVFETMLANPAANRRVELSLVTNPAIKAVGVVREIAPTVDVQKGTIRVKVEIDGAPAEMGLGTPISGVFPSSNHTTVVLPWTAFFADRGKPAVWVVDPQTHAVALKPVVAQSYRTGKLIVSAGLGENELVVTRGGQLLRPGEIVSPQHAGTDTSGARL
ncbi:MAG: efflux RND transporter periplasmic adaptor subunit [Ferrovibrio sp.]|uniref:efflux RND transporter periplasmic adaptor subunit n=1 Tax=Ferrovibrio sp. TaxID=1917215 RepID=UPI00391D86EC